MDRRSFIKKAGWLGSGAAAATALAASGHCANHAESHMALFFGFSEALDTIYGAAEVFAQAGFRSH